LFQNLDALFSVQRVLASGKRLFSVNGEPLNGQPVSLEIKELGERTLESGWKERVTNIGRSKRKGKVLKHAI